MIQQINKKYIVNIIFFIFPAVTVASLIILADRNIDITDEGFLLLGYKHPEEAISLTTYLPVILGKITAMLAPSPYFFRLLRLIILSTSATFFAYKIAKSTEITLSKAHIICVTLMASYLCYTKDHRTISYNTIVLITAFLSVETISTITDNKPKKWLLLGVTLGFLLWIKFPSAIATFLFIILISILYKSTYLPYLFAGWIFGLCIFFLFKSPKDAVLNLNSALAAASDGLHNPFELMKWHAKTSLELMNKILKIPFISIITVCCWFVFKKTKGKKIVINLLLISGTIYAGAAGIIYKTPVIMMTDLLLLTTVLLLSFSIKNKKFEPNNKKRRIVILSLIIAPYLCMIGTNVRSEVVLTHFLGLWGLLYVYLTDLLRKKASDNGISIMTAPLFFILCSFSAYMIYDGAIIHPYRSTHSLWDYTEKSSIPELNKVKLDKESILFLENLYKVLHEKTYFKSGDPILALYDMPGLVYLLDGTSPGTPWYLLSKDEHKRNCTAIKASKMSNLDRTIILQNVPAIPLSMVKCMREAGINYPQDYVIYSRSFINPFIVSELLKSKYKTVIHIAVPKKMIRKNHILYKGNKLGH